MKKRQGRKRQYTEKDKATALAVLKANKGNAKKTAIELKIPRATLQKWAKGEGISRDVPLKQHEKEENLADLFDQIGRVYGQHALDPEVIAKTNGKDSVTAAAIAAEKRQLLRGDPTDIIGRQGGRTDDECLKRIEELMVEINAGAASESGLAPV